MTRKEVVDRLTAELNFYLIEDLQMSYSEKYAFVRRYIQMAVTAGGELFGQRRGKHVVQYSLTGKIIKEYKDISEAARLTGICRMCITKNVLGQRKTAGGYIFKKFKGDETKVDFFDNLSDSIKLLGDKTVANANHN